jgi:hypothetical protein
LERIGPSTEQICQQPPAQDCRAFHLPNADSQAGREQPALGGWVDTDLFHFFRAELKGSLEERRVIREQLLRDARGSNHPVTNRFFALRAIALCHWAEGNEAEALQQYQACADKRQSAFPYVHVESRHRSASPGGHGDRTWRSCDSSLRRVSWIDWS